MLYNIRGDTRGCSSVGERFLGMEEVVGSTPISSTRVPNAQRLQKATRYPPAWVVRIAISAFFLSAVLALPVRIAAREKPEVWMPDVLVLIHVSGTVDSVSFTYASAVERARAERHLQSLLAETRWTATTTTITDGPPTEIDGTPMTSVEFSTVGAVALDAGGLLLEPIIKAFKDLERIGVIYVISAPFSFRGLGDYENQHVRIAFRHGADTYEYSVTIKDADFETLGLPFLQPETAAHTDDPGNKSSPPQVFKVAAVLILALLAAAFAYLVARRISRA